MEKTPTRQRVLSEGLRLFAEKGYKAVSMEQIASAVGIKAPSLYKHFAGKQEIFRTIIGEMKERHRQNMLEIQIRGGAELDAELFLQADEERMVEIGRGLFQYYLHDEVFSNFRKMLTLGQYADADIAALLVAECMAGPLSYNEQLFGLMIGAGAFKKSPPKVMALHFYAPIYMLLLICDVNPGLEAESMETLDAHIRQFIRMYGAEKEKTQ